MSRKDLFYHIAYFIDNKWNIRTIDIWTIEYVNLHMQDRESTKLVWTTTSIDHQEENEKVKKNYWKTNLCNIQCFIESEFSNQEDFISFSMSFCKKKVVIY